MSVNACEHLREETVSYLLCAGRFIFVIPRYFHNNPLKSGKLNLLREKVCNFVLKDLLGIHWDFSVKAVATWKGKWEQFSLVFWGISEFSK